MSSSNAGSLRQVLQKTDNTAAAIQASANAMMKFYSTSPQIAVSEWRNVLMASSTSTCNSSLSLLYVANEVLQTSKRNRGNKFLEAFSPILESSLRWMCSNFDSAPELVEKVRRTTKIWGDRRVFSVRFVGDLLNSLEEYRNHKTKKKELKSSFNNSHDDKTNTSINNAPVKGAREKTSSPSSSVSSFKSNNDLAEDDEDSPFGTRGPSLLDVTIDRNALQQPPTPSPSHKSTNARKKRRRTSGAPSPYSDKVDDDNNLSHNHNSTSSHQIDRNPPVNLTMSYMSKLLSNLESLEQETRKVEDFPSIQEDDLDLSNLYGEELIELSKKVNKSIKHVEQHDRALVHFVAQQRRLMEGQFQRFIPWMQHAIQHESKDALELCEFVEENLLLLQTVHGDACKERERRRDQKAKMEAQQQAETRRKAEEEELKRSLQTVIKKDVKSGMVWNTTTREYQYLPDHTEESWRG